MQLKHKKLVNMFIIIMVMTTSFAAGWMFRDADNAIAQDDDNEFVLLQETQRLLAEHYYTDLPDETELEYAAIRGYLSHFDDPFTFFIDPPVAQSESNALAGRYGGIGVDIQRNEAGQLVLFPFEDSPAARVGVLQGDLLIDINEGELVAGERIDVIRQQLRGEIVEGEENGVTVTVLTEGETQPRTYFILFEEITIPTVTWRVLEEDPQIGYLKIRSFTSLVEEEFAVAIEDLRSQNITALILDLRGNTGGLLQESINIAGEFIDEGVILREQNRQGENERVDSPGGLVTDLPIYILIDDRTASASEVVVGALTDTGRAVTVGQKTFGKGSVQFIFPLSDGSSIHLTSSIWFTPNGTPIDGVGIEPDIFMIPDENGRDVELAEAVRRIQSER